MTTAMPECGSRPHRRVHTATELPFSTFLEGNLDRHLSLIRIARRVRTEERQRFQPRARSLRATDRARLAESESPAGLPTWPPLRPGVTHQRNLARRSSISTRATEGKRLGSVFLMTQVSNVAARVCDGREMTTETRSSSKRGG